MALLKDCEKSSRAGAINMALLTECTFADWSLAAHVYAIHLSANVEDENKVIVVYDYRPITVANSFSKFIEAYLANNDSVLFPQPPVEYSGE